MISPTRMCQVLNAVTPVLILLGPCIIPSPLRSMGWRINPTRPWSFRVGVCDPDHCDPGDPYGRSVIDSYEFKKNADNPVAVVALVKAKLEGAVRSYERALKRR